MTYSFLQQYWWFIISLLGALLVFLLFVQGANSMIFQLGTDKDSRRLLINSTGRKWEFTFTTLVTFGGAFFASFPLFYSTSFGGLFFLSRLLFRFLFGLGRFFRLLSDSDRVRSAESRDESQDDRGD